MFKEPKYSAGCLIQKSIKMETLKFKTNINCGSCIRSVTGFINEVKGIEHWEVDTDNPDKILTVQGQVSTREVMDAVEDAGFDIQPVASAG